MEMKMSRVFPILFVSFSVALAQFGSPSLTLRAPNSLRGDGFGFTLAAGDLNNAGALDLAVADVRDQVFVFYGEPSFDGTADVDISGPTLSGFGLALATGDFNGDGKTDLAVGAPEFSLEEGMVASGRVLVYFGGTGFGAAASFVADDPSPTDLGLFGSALAAGDVNDDGTTDLIVGSPGRDAVIVFFGGEGFGAESQVIEGPEMWISFGAALSAEDVNGDGTADILVGAPDATVAGSASAGTVFVYLGGTAIGDQPDAIIPNPEPTGDSDLFGATLVVGDVNGDQEPDLIVGAPAATVGRHLGAGKVFIFPGPVISNSGGAGAHTVRGLTNPVVIRRPFVQSGSMFGSALASGDLNLDGVADLVIGAGRSQTWGALELGEVYIYYGRQPLRTTPGVVLRPPSPVFTGSFGASVLLADISGDSVLDLAVGATGVTTGGSSGSGKVFLYLGKVQERGAMPAMNRTKSASALQTSVASRYLKPFKRLPSH